MAEVSIDNVLERISSLDLGFQVEESFNDTAKQYIDKQREQLFSGIDATGDPISPPYAARTIAIKKQKGQPTDRVTLRDTGAFYQDMFLDVRPEELIIDSVDAKSDELQKKYGDEILGLTTENEDEYVEENLDPVFQERVQNALEL